MMQVLILVKGEYVICGGPSDFFPGNTLKNKIDSLISGDSGALVKQGVVGLNEKVWFTRQQTSGTMIVIPAGHIYIMIGSHEADKAGIVSCLQWNYLDTGSKLQHSTCCNTLRDMMASYTEMNDADHQAFLRYLQGLPIATA